MLGEVDKYSWVDIGSSFLMSELNAAYLHAQLECSSIIRNIRLNQWDAYRFLLNEFKDKHGMKWQEYNSTVDHNAHIFYLILPDENFRTRFISKMRESNIVCASHYVPLHSSEAGLKYSRTKSEMTVTNSYSSRLVRLPMWSHEELPIEKIVREVVEIGNNLRLV
jgi:dTDP-4-amino-4,6-dideoxygalactose transaminase